MARRRLGVALLVDPPVAGELDGLRRALGDPTLGRMRPHLTLVPPVNVKEEHLGEALRTLRHAASASVGPLRLTLGSFSTFLPVNPVGFLQVGGDLEVLAALRAAVFRSPLERALTWPWVPHVTLADGIPGERLEAAESCLGGYGAVVVIDRVVLLEESGGRVWTPIADARLGRPSVVGTGGLELEITAGRLLDPEVVAMVAAESSQPRAVPSPSPGWPGPPNFPAIVHAARREGSPVGLAAAWVDAAGPHVRVYVRRDARLQGVGTQLLRSVERAASAAGWAFPVVQAEGPEGFYSARSAWSVVTRTSPRSTGTAS